MKKIKEAIVLAGGMGTRLRSVVKDLPKPMADVCGSPFLTHLLDFLSSSGVESVVLSVGHMRDSVIGHYGFCHNGMEIDYAVEESPLGTGGAIREALKHVDGEDAFILNGDSIIILDLRKMAKFHRGNGASLTMAIKPVSDCSRYGAVRLEGHKVIGFEEKGVRGPGYINAGVYAVRKDCFTNLPGWRFSFENDFLRSNTEGTYAFISDDYFIDIGIPEDYMKAQTELVQALKGGTHDNLKNAAQDLIFRRRH